MRVREQVIAEPEVKTSQLVLMTKDSPTQENPLDRTNYPQSLCHWEAERGGSTKVTVDESTPEFKRIQARGGIVNNPFSTHTVTFDGPDPVNFHHRTSRMVDGVELYWDWSGTYLPFAFGSAPDLLVPTTEIVGNAKQRCIDAAVAQAHSRVNVSEMLALVTLAESRKTVDSVKSILTRVVRIARNVRRANIAGLAREISPREVANRYMEARYALRPLYYEATGVIKSANKVGSSFRKTFRGKSGETANYTDSPAESVFFHETLVGVKRTLSVEYSARAGVLAQATVERLNAYGGDRIASSLWELVPLSFVLGWFCNVADIIGAWEPKANIDQLASFVTVRTKIVAKNEVVSMRSTGPSWWSKDNLSSAGPVVWSREELVLERFVEPPLPLVPQTSLNLTSWRLLDLGIILRQLAGRV